MVSIDDRIESLQNTIDSLMYWDAGVANFECKYLGDEVTLYINLDDEIAEIAFKFCYIVNYRGDLEHCEKGTEMKLKNRFGHDVQNISVKKSSEYSSMMEINLDFILFEVSIICRDITITKRPFAEYHFFWQDN